jgi:hypothetical protein
VSIAVAFRLELRCVSDPVSEAAIKILVFHRRVGLLAAIAISLAVDPGIVAAFGIGNLTFLFPWNPSVQAG